MPKDILEEFLTFSLDPQHRISIRGAELRFIHLSDGVATFHAAENVRYTVRYELAELNRMNRAGEITVVPYFHLPAHLRPVPVVEDGQAFLAGLSPAQQKRVAYRYAMVRGFEELKTSGKVQCTDHSITENMDAIRAAAEGYFQETMPDPAYSEQLTLWKDGKARKPSTPRETRYPGPCSPRSLRIWVSLHRKAGKAALIDRSAKQGNATSIFNADELQLLGETVRNAYLKEDRKTIANVVEIVKARFAEANEDRAKKGLPHLRTPGRDAVRGVIRRFDVFAAYVARHGLEKAVQRFRPVKGGVEVSRPFERVEMDEQQIDVIAIMAYSGLLALFSAEELETLGLLDKKKRWWLVLAIDCRTRCIVGMVLTCNPRSSAALGCLRMVVSDKGEFANMIGTRAPWSIFGTPETLVTDNGAAFKSLIFTSACTDLGITALQTIAGMPSMRGVGERVFKTLSTTLMPNLPGRTFSNVTERDAYEAEKRASLGLEDLAVILVRWAVDIYHNTPHGGLGGRTPLQQWEADLRSGNTPLRTAPSARRKHLALGTAISRKLQKTGIRVLNVQYFSQDLAKYFLKHGSEGLEIRWNEKDLGAIEVNFEGGWQTVPAVSDVFKGLSAAIWVKATRSLAAKDPERKKWDENIVFQAIRDIETMIAQAKLALNIFDQNWTEDRINRTESDLLSQFDPVPSSAKTSHPSDGMGRKVNPKAPTDADTDAARIAPYAHALPRQTESKSDTQPAAVSRPTTTAKSRRGRKDDDGFRFPE